MRLYQTLKSLSLMFCFWYPGNFVLHLEQKRNHHLNKTKKNNQTFGKYIILIVNVVTIWKCWCFLASTVHTCMLLVTQHIRFVTNILLKIDLLSIWNFCLLYSMNLQNCSRWIGEKHFWPQNGIVLWNCNRQMTSVC